MRIGLLWYDDDPRRGLDEKVRQAATRYRQKFGVAPDVCYVNDKSIDQAEVRVGDLRVVRAATVLPNHFWIGQAG